MRVLGLGRPKQGKPGLIGLGFSFRLGLLVAVAFALVSFLLPQRFTSVARILPADTRGAGSLGQLSAAVAAMGMTLPGQDAGDANFVDILASRTVAQEILSARYQFQERFLPFGRYRTHHETLYEYLEARNLDQAVRKLGQILNAARDAKTKVITVRAETRSPELSQQIVCHATDGLEKFLKTKAHTKGGEKARFARERLATGRAEAAQVEESLRRFVEANRNYQASPDPSVRLPGLRLEAEFKLRQQLVASMALSLEQALMEEKDDIPVVNLLDPGNLPTERSWPKRTVIVSFGFLVAFFTSWGWLNRTWIFPASGEIPPSGT